MDRASIFERLARLLCEVLEIEGLPITPELSAHDVNGWDSLSNVLLFVEIEKTFSIHFSAAEIASLRDVGQLAAAIEQKTRGRSQ